MEILILTFEMYPNIIVHQIFFDALYSRGLFPLIAKPSRITLNGATLIDNVLVNDLQNTIRSGLLINDITEHLPVFAVYDSKAKRKEGDMCTRYVRVRDADAIHAFRNDLLREQWRGVYGDDVDAAYE